VLVFVNVYMKQNKIICLKDYSTYKLLFNYHTKHFVFNASIIKILFATKISLS